MKKMNKRADSGDNTMFFVFFFLIIIVSAGIVGGAFVFYGKEFDFKNIESQMLFQDTKNCLSSSEFDFNRVKDDPYYFYEKCQLNETVLGNYLGLKVCVDTKNFENCFESSDAIIRVGSNFQACLFEGSKGNNNFPKCINGTFVRDGKAYALIVSSHHSARRVLA